MKAKQITYERVKSVNFNNEKVGIVYELDEGENPEEIMKKAKDFIAKQLGDVIEESYYVSGRCKNCGELFGLYGNKSLEISVGKSISEHRCPNCGCFDLEKG